MFYVYEHWRPDKDEPFYVGKGRGNRANLMKRRNKRHKSIQEKLHKIGYAVEVKIVAANLTEKEAFSLEKKRIAMWRAAGIDLANMTDGGEGPSGRIGLRGEKHPSYGKPSHMLGKKHTEETRKKLSDAAKGKKSRLGAVLSEETKRKISESQKGKKHSEETKAKMRATHITIGTKPPVLCGAKNPFYGRKHTEETKQKISLAKKEGQINAP